jgi:hypothetical protein
VRRKGKKTAKRRVKLPIRLDAKPTRPHTTKKGKRGYNRRRAKRLIRKEMEGDEQGR